jgi:hypothetical protein
MVNRAKVDWASDIGPLAKAAVGNGLQRPEDAWVIQRSEGDAEADYAAGYVYVRRKSPDNPEYIVARIIPDIRRKLVAGLCVKIQLADADEFGCAWEVIGLGSRSFEQYQGGTPDEGASPHDHQTEAGGGTLDAAAIATGTFDDARLSANVMLLDATQTVTGPKTFGSGDLIATDADLNTPDIDGGTITGATELTIVSTSSGSIPMPVMTEAQRDAIASPVEGMWIFNSDTSAPNYYDGADWIQVGTGGIIDAADVTYTPGAPSQWPDPDPTTAEEALDSLADQVDTLTGLVGGGAPDTANYIVGVASAGLSAETVIPGLRGSPDIAGAAGGGIDEEYDTTSTGLTWSSAPAVEDSNTTALSHLYVLSNDTSERFGFRSWSPAGTFDVRCKIALFSDHATNNRAIGMMVADAGNTNRILIGLAQAGLTITLQSYTYTGGVYTSLHTATTLNYNEVYLRMARDGSNNISFYYSVNGLAWIKRAVPSFTFTPTQVGFRMAADASGDYGFYCDWLRTDV